MLTKGLFFSKSAPSMDTSCIKGFCRFRERWVLDAEINGCFVEI